MTEAVLTWTIRATQALKPGTAGQRRHGQFFATESQQHKRGAQKFKKNNMPVESCFWLSILTYLVKFFTSSSDALFYG
jgi:hypothetical protein